MAIPVLIMGKSGSGKSASFRSMDSLLVINVNKKKLPFKPKESIVTYETDDYDKIKSALKVGYTKGYLSAAIDDAGYLLTSKFMQGHRAAKGNSLYDFYNELADNFYSLIRFVNDDLPNDMIVYIIMHEDKNEMGESKPRTIGRLLDEKVCVEGMFTIVLHAMKLDGRYVFATNTDGLDVTKTPIGMFGTNYVDNDLKKIDETIREYYK